MSDYRICKVCKMKVVVGTVWHGEKGKNGKIVSCRGLEGYDTPKSSKTKPLK